MTIHPNLLLRIEIIEGKDARQYLVDRIYIISMRNPDSERENIRFLIHYITKDCKIKAALRIVF